MTPSNHQPFFTWIEETFERPENIPLRVREEMVALWLNGVMVEAIAELFSVPPDWVETVVVNSIVADAPRDFPPELDTRVTLASYLSARSKAVPSNCRRHRASPVGWWSARPSRPRYLPSAHHDGSACTGAVVRKSPVKERA
jgi:hypothetical protein